MLRCNILTILIAREWRSQSVMSSFCWNIRPRARNQERQEIAPVKQRLSPLGSSMSWRSHLGSYTIWLAISCPHAPHVRARLVTRG